MITSPSGFFSRLQMAESTMVSWNPSVRKRGTRCSRSTPGLTGRSRMISSIASRVEGSDLRGQFRRDRPSGMTVRCWGAQAPWTAWWLGSFFYVALRAVWTVAHLGPAPMPVWLALVPYAVALYGTSFGARVLRRERVTVPVAGLPSGWRGARIVQLSDLHSGRHVTKERLRAIARRAARLDPDVLVVTGDIVHNSPLFARQAAEAIASIPARHGVFACLGNHDFWAGPDAVEHELERAGVRVLRNRGLLLERGGDGLWLCGVDDPWSGRFDLRAALKGRPEGAATVLLSHQPNTWRRAQDLGVELQLSGHTHGGQVALLWLHRSLSLARFITPFVAGLYSAGRSYLYVNRGAGSVMPMVRLGARPEVTELTLIPASESNDALALATS